MAPLFVKMAQNLDLRCALVPAPWVTLGAGAKTRLESRIKKFTPHCVCRPREASSTASESHIITSLPLFQKGSYWLRSRSYCYCYVFIYDLGVSGFRYTTRTVFRTMMERYEDNPNHGKAIFDLPVLSPDGKQAQQFQELLAEPVWKHLFTRLMFSAASMVGASHVSYL